MFKACLSGSFLLAACAAALIASMALGQPAGQAPPEKKSPPASNAKRPSAPASGFGPCAEDVKRLCGELKPGQGRVYRCLNEKQAEASAACKEHLVERRAEFREEHVACRADARKFCSGIRPGQGRVAACLKSHAAELAPECRQEFPNR